jgi:hypothetical protein
MRQKGSVEDQELGMLTDPFECTFSRMEIASIAMQATISTDILQTNSDVNGQIRAKKDSGKGWVNPITHVWEPLLYASHRLTPSISMTCIFKPS